MDGLLTSTNSLKKGLQVVFSLFRTIHCSDIEIWLKIFKMYVLPLLEYCSSVWSPCLKKDIRRLESVQKTFTRILYYRALPDPAYPHTLPPYHTRLSELNLKSLFYRRIQADVVLAFKILKGELRLKPSSYWIFRPSRGRVGGLFSIAPKTGRAKYSICDNSFFSRTTQWLDRLPETVLKCENSKQFKRAIKKIDLLSVLGVPDVR